MSGAKETAKVTGGCSVTLCVAGFCLYYAITAGYQRLDQAGWISRDHNTPVWIQADWLMGEYRECDMLTTTSPVKGSVLSEEKRAELPRLFCGRNDPLSLGSLVEFENAVPDVTAALSAVDGEGNWSAFDSYFHVLPVHYYGRIDRPDKWRDSWQCQRLSASLECKALN